MFHRRTSPFGVMEIRTLPRHLTREVGCDRDRLAMVAGPGVRLHTLCLVDPFSGSHHSLAVELGALFSERTGAPYPGHLANP